MVFLRRQMLVWACTILAAGSPWPCSGVSAKLPNKNDLSKQKDRARRDLASTKEEAKNEWVAYFTKEMQAKLAEELNDLPGVWDRIIGDDTSTAFAAVREATNEAEIKSAVTVYERKLKRKSQDMPLWSLFAKRD